MDGSDRSLGFLESAAPKHQAGLPSRGPVREAALEISKRQRAGRLWGQPFENILDMLEAAITRFAFRGHIKKLRETGAMRGPAAPVRVNP